ncbi:hypothetical protein HAX54_002237 [Datura stramonium]|uniref:Uncharacterized protein n=1 Tax=Datura stramonium TaxID=4076 RepID=A0ABS8T4B6_DATST|nr:hypothetical protein [Datura stramonium]
MIEFLQDIKQSLGAAVGDLHRCNESMAILIFDVANMKKQLTHIQHEGVKSFNKVQRMIGAEEGTNKGNPWTIVWTNDPLYGSLVLQVEI